MRILTVSIDFDTLQRCRFGILIAKDQLPRRRKKYKHEANQSNEPYAVVHLCICL